MTEQEATRPDSRQEVLARLVRAVDQILATYRAHWRAGEDVIVESEALALALAYDDWKLRDGAIQGVK